MNRTSTQIMSKKTESVIKNFQSPGPHGFTDELYQTFTEYQSFSNPFKN